MTVRELIRELETIQDDDLEVCVEGFDVTGWIPKYVGQPDCYIELITRDQLDSGQKDRRTDRRQ